MRNISSEYPTTVPALGRRRCLHTANRDGPQSITLRYDWPSSCVTSITSLGHVSGTSSDSCLHLGWDQIDRLAHHTSSRETPDKDERTTSSGLLDGQPDRHQAAKLQPAAAVAHAADDSLATAALAAAPVTGSSESAATPSGISSHNSCTSRRQKLHSSLRLLAHLVATLRVFASMNQH